MAMVYQVSGCTRHIIGGVTELELKAGPLLFLGWGTEHEIKAAGMEDIAVNFFLIPAFFDNAAISIGGNSALSVFLTGNLTSKKKHSGYLVFNLKDAPEVENLLENLILGQMNGIPASIQQLTLELLMQHLSRMSQRVVIQNQMDYEQAIVFGILNRIKTQMWLSLSQEARELQMDVTALSRLIQKYTGCSFTELLHTARFNRAIQMLRETDLSVTDIAGAVGYENTAFFYRRFGEKNILDDDEIRQLMEKIEGAIFEDSIELSCGTIPWTNRFAENFKTLRGYDILPFLPVLQSLRGSP